MSEGAKDADVDRLTRERIEELSSRGLGLDKVEFQQLCDLALSALSQEAVRDEALGPTPEQWQEFYDRVWDSDETNPTLALPTSELQRIGRALLAALKREPNAAGEETGKGQAVSAIQPSTPDSSGPAPAAPDVAGIVKEFNAMCDAFAADDEGLSLTPDVWNRLRNDLRKAVALLTKLGQDGVDAARYRHWRNAKIGEASHDYHFDALLGKIENACDLAREIDSAIDADMATLPARSLG